MSRDEMIEVMAIAAAKASNFNFHGFNAETQAKYLRHQSAALAALEAAGMVLVPRAPTEAMVRAACIAIEQAPITDLGNDHGYADEWRASAIASYQAMLAESPIKAKP